MKNQKTLKSYKKKISIGISDINKIRDTFAVHHIHVKCGDEFLTIMHRGGFCEASELMDELVKFLTEGNKK